jgi:hypothetical protein
MTAQHSKRKRSALSKPLLAVSGIVCERPQTSSIFSSKRAAEPTREPINWRSVGDASPEDDKQMQRCCLDKTPSSLSSLCCHRCWSAAQFLSICPNLLTAGLRRRLVGSCLLVKHPASTSDEWKERQMPSTKTPDHLSRTDDEESNKQRCAAPLQPEPHRSQNRGALIRSKNESV